MKCTGKLNRALIEGFFVATEVPLNFDVYIVVSEDINEPFEPAFAFIDATATQGYCEWPLFTSGQTDHAGRAFLKFMFFDRAFALGGTHFHACDRAAKVLITQPAFDKDRIGDRSGR